MFRIFRIYQKGNNLALTPGKYKASHQQHCHKQKEGVRISHI